jgi:L-fuconolactonase
MDIVDAQIHPFAPSEAAHPWSPRVLSDPLYAGMRGRYAGRSARPEEILAALDAHGVAGALLVTSSLYGFDNGYGLAAHESAPSRFRLVGLVDATDEDVEGRVDAWADQPGAVGLRLNLWAEEALARFHDGGDDRLLAAAQRRGLAVAVNAPNRMDAIETMARRFETLQIVLDHLGLFDVAMLYPEYVDDVYAGVDDVVRLARFENVAVKMTSVPLLSREPWPHADAAPHLRAIVSAFGAERVMWGSDAFAFDHPYDENLNFLDRIGDFSDSERELIFGGALRRIWKWPAPAPAGVSS